MPTEGANRQPQSEWETGSSEAGSGETLDFCLIFLGVHLAQHLRDKYKHIQFFFGKARPFVPSSGTSNGDTGQLMAHSPGAGMRFYPVDISHFHSVTLPIHGTSRFPHDQVLDWTLPRGRPKLHHDGRMVVHALCKDQDGCRYLQKKLKNHIPDQVHMIWLENNQHIIEFMTDPFGNHVSGRIIRVQHMLSITSHV